MNVKLTSQEFVDIDGLPSKVSHGDIRVYLDGNFVNHCVEADDFFGYVIVWPSLEYGLVFEEEILHNQLGYSVEELRPRMLYGDVLIQDLSPAFKEDN